MKIEFNGANARYYLRNIHRYRRGVYGKELTPPSNDRIIWSFPNARDRDYHYCAVEAHTVHLRALHRVIIDDLRQFARGAPVPEYPDSYMIDASWHGARIANIAIFQSLPKFWR